MEPLNWKFAPFTVAVIPATATTQPPVTQPPVTQPPVTQPPVTQPPVTQPPVTTPPTPPGPTMTGNIVELVGNNLLKDVDPCPLRTCAYSRTDGQEGIFAYSGMCYLPYWGKYGALIVCAGGHDDYWGSELYLYDLDPAVAMWFRITDPPVSMMSPGVAPDTDPRNAATVMFGEFPDGSPMATHDYNTKIAIPGGTNGQGIVLAITQPVLSGTGSRSTAWTHAADLGLAGATPIASNKLWSRFSVNAGLKDGASTVAQMVCYDATRGRVWELPKGGFTPNIGYLDLATRTHTPTLITDGSRWANFGISPCAAAAPINDLMLYVTSIGADGGPLAFQLGALDLNNPSAGPTILKLAGDIPPNAILAPGFDWDTNGDFGYVLTGNSTHETINSDLAHVYQIAKPTGATTKSALLSGTWTLTKIALPQAVPASVGDGIYSRWRYCTKIGKFAMVSARANKVLLWTPPNSAAIPIPIPSTPPIVNPLQTQLDAANATIAQLTTDKAALIARLTQLGADVEAIMVAATKAKADE